MMVPMEWQYRLMGESCDEEVLFINFEKVSDRQVLTVELSLKGSFIVHPIDGTHWFFEIDKYNRFFDLASGGFYLTPHEFVLSVVNLYPPNNGTEKLEFVHKYKPGGIYNLFLDKVDGGDPFCIPDKSEVEMEYIYNEMLDVFLAYDVDCRTVFGEFYIRNGYVLGACGTQFLTIEEAIVAGFNVTYKDEIPHYPVPYDAEEAPLLGTYAHILGVPFYESIDKEAITEK